MQVNLTLGNDRLSRNAGDYQSALRKTPEERSFRISRLRWLMSYCSYKISWKSVSWFWIWKFLFHYFCPSFSRVSVALRIGYFI